CEEDDSYTHSHCYLACSDGVVEKKRGEQCDDANTRSGDGCSSSCKVETGYICSVTGHNPSRCVLACGDRVLHKKLGAKCDEGNRRAGDGCNSLFPLETGYKCSAMVTNDPTSESFCWLKCGDHYTETSEECDDGNRYDGDGCSSTCKTETGWKCIHQSAHQTY